MDYQTIFTPPLPTFPLVDINPAQVIPSLLGLSSDSLTASTLSLSLDPFRLSSLPDLPADIAPSLPFTIDHVKRCSIDDDIISSPQTLEMKHDETSPKEHHGSSDEGKQLTPAQSRRKAQNRAAQRAFRERKERHVKELEAKLCALESSATSLATDNQRLKLLLQRATTENELLRARSRSSAQDLSKSTADPPRETTTSRNSPISPKTEAVEIALGDIPPLSTTAKDGLLLDGDLLAEGLTTNPLLATLSPLETSSPGNDRLTSDDNCVVPAASIWDLIQGHPFVKQGHVDVADLCTQLKDVVICSEQGPVFLAGDIRRAIERSRRASQADIMPL